MNFGSGLELSKKVIFALPDNKTCAYVNSTDSWARLKHLELMMESADYSTFNSVRTSVFFELVVAAIGMALNFTLAFLLIALRLQRCRLPRHYYLLMSMVCMDIATTSALLVFASEHAYKRLNPGKPAVHSSPQYYKRAVVTLRLVELLRRQNKNDSFGWSNEANDTVMFSDGWLFNPARPDELDLKDDVVVSHKFEAHDFLGMLYLSLRLMPIGPALHYIAISALQMYSVVDPIMYIRRVHHGFCVRLAVGLWLLSFVVLAAIMSVIYRCPGLPIGLFLHRGYDFVKGVLIPTMVTSGIMSVSIFGIFVIVVVVTNVVTYRVLHMRKDNLRRQSSVSFRFVRVQIVVYIISSLLIMVFSALEVQTTIRTIYFLPDNCSLLFETWISNITHLFYYATLLEVSPLFWFLRACIEPILVLVGNDELRARVKAAWKSKSCKLIILSRNQSIELRSAHAVPQRS